VEARLSWMKGQRGVSWVFVMLGLLVCLQVVGSLLLWVIDEHH